MTEVSPRAVRILCAISILLNVFLVAGVVGGAVWLHARPNRIVAGSLRIAGSELPADERIAFRQALREERRAMRPTIQAGRQARAEAALLLRAPTLDKAALAAALARVRAADFALRSGIEERAILFAATLPPSDRAKLADGILRRPGMHKRVNDGSAP